METVASSLEKADFQHTKARSAGKDAEGEKGRAGARACFYCNSDGLIGGRSPRNRGFGFASKEMETKIDDAPRNAKELPAHEEYEEVVNSGKLEIK
jgi:hypothetical protein